MVKGQIDIEDFLKVDIRVGTILSAKINQKARKPAYILEIDFGDEIGTKITSAQITQNYSINELIGKQVCAVVNFPIKRIAGVKSEVLVLAVVCKDNGTVLLQPDREVVNGERIA